MTLPQSDERNQTTAARMLHKEEQATLALLSSEEQAARTTASNSVTPARTAKRSKKGSTRHHTGPRQLQLSPPRLLFTSSPAAHTIPTATNCSAAGPSSTALAASASSSSPALLVAATTPEQRMEIGQEMQRCERHQQLRFLNSISQLSRSQLQPRFLLILDGFYLRVSDSENWTQGPNIHRARFHHCNGIHRFNRSALQGRYRFSLRLRRDKLRVIRSYCFNNFVTRQVPAVYMFATHFRVREIVCVYVSVGVFAWFHGNASLLSCSALQRP